MESLDIPSYSLLENSSTNGFDINKFEQLADFKLLYLNRKTYWLGRNYKNQFMSESYLLYRIAHFKMLRLKFLDYILKQYNAALDRFKEEYIISGEIITTSTRIDYDKYLTDLKDGKLNTTQVSDVINSLT
jgi:hypothetical protein